MHWSKFRGKNKLNEIYIYIYKHHILASVSNNISFFIDFLIMQYSVLLFWLTHILSHNITPRVNSLISTNVSHLTLHIAMCLSLCKCFLLTTTWQDDPCFFYTSIVEAENKQWVRLEGREGIRNSPSSNTLRVSLAPNKPNLISLPPLMSKRLSVPPTRTEHFLSWSVMLVVKILRIA